MAKQTQEQEQEKQTDGDLVGELTEEQREGLTKEQFYNLTHGLEADEIRDQEIEDARFAAAGMPVEKVCERTGRSPENIKIILEKHAAVLRRRSTQKRP